MLPFNPVPGFQWIMLTICILFAFLDPKTAFISVLWFGFASHYLCNKVSLKLVKKRFIIPGRYTKNKELHPIGLLLLVPFSLGSIYPAIFLRDLAKLFHEYIV